MPDRKLKKEDCIRLLLQKKELLLLQGLTRYPQRSDFEEHEVVAIKAFFGPWPRALEEAGIKPQRSDDKQQRNREKRIRAKRARNAARKIQKQHSEEPQKEH